VTSTPLLIDTSALMLLMKAAAMIKSNLSKIALAF